jgi:hypothetical protein
MLIFQIKVKRKMFAESAILEMKIARYKITRFKIQDCKSEENIRV